MKRLSYAHALSMDYIGECSDEVTDVASMANCFIVMHNNISHKYQTGVLLSIIENKKKYRFCANICNRILHLQNEYERKLGINASEVGEDAMKQLDIIGDTVIDGFANKLIQYQKAVDDWMLNEGQPDKLISMLYVSMKLVQKATKTCDTQLRWMDKTWSKLSSIEGWMSNRKMIPLYEQLINQLKLKDLFDKADADKSLLQFQYKCYSRMDNGRFIADHSNIDKDDPKYLEYYNRLCNHKN